MNDELIVGRNPVFEALRAGREINKLMINEGSRGRQLSELIELAKEKHIFIQYVPKQKLDRLAEATNHQGIVASVAAYDYATIDDFFAKASALNEQPFFLLLDEIEDPHNLGSILRTADCAGVHGVIIPKRRSVGLTATVAKASTGALEYVPVARVSNLAQTMEGLKKQGLWFVGADANGSQDYRVSNYELPICLVIGNEGKGIGRLIKQKCDFLVNLPMRGNVTSLNASVAAGILMYEVYRTRSPIGD